MSAKVPDRELLAKQDECEHEWERSPDTPPVKYPAAYAGLDPYWLLPGHQCRKCSFTIGQRLPVRGRTRRAS